MRNCSHIKLYPRSTCIQLIHSSSIERSAIAILDITYLSDEQQLKRLESGSQTEKAFKSQNILQCSCLSVVVTATPSNEDRIYNAKCTKITLFVKLTNKKYKAFLEVTKNSRKKILTKLTNQIQTIHEFKTVVVILGQKMMSKGENSCQKI